MITSSSRLSALVLASASALAGLAGACGDDTSGTGGSSATGQGGGAQGGAGQGGAGQGGGGTSNSTGAATGGGGSGGSPALAPTPPADPGEPWDLLSEWNLFVDGPDQVPADRVVPYDVIAPLFSDEAAKLRFLHVPEGASITYSDEGPWGFPEGTILVKTFAYPEDARDAASPLQLLETRLLWRTSEGWKTHTYIWNEEGTDAERKSAGAVLPVAWVDAEGDERQLDYAVPNTNQCKECHSQDEVIETLGGVTLQLDRDLDGMNQIDRFAELGFFDGAPTPHAERTRLVDPWGEDDLALRGRAYLHANCASCHKPGGEASEFGLYLDHASTGPEDDPSNLGVCKTPTSAGGATCGLTFDVVPGDPDASILICRIETDVPEDRMPPVGRQIVHGEGVTLLRELIAAMPAVDCAPPKP